MFFFSIKLHIILLGIGGRGPVGLSQLSVGIGLERNTIGVIFIVQITCAGQPIGHADCTWKLESVLTTDRPSALANAMQHALVHVKGMH
jgi:hypothetical protein